MCVVNVYMGEEREAGGVGEEASNDRGVEKKTKLHKMFLRNQEKRMILSRSLISALSTYKKHKHTVAAAVLLS